MHIYVSCTLGETLLLQFFCCTNLKDWDWRIRGIGGKRGMRNRDEGREMRNVEGRRGLVGERRVMVGGRRVMVGGRRVMVGERRVMVGGRRCWWERAE